MKRHWLVTGAMITAAALALSACSTTDDAANDDTAAVETPAESTDSDQSDQDDGSQSESDGATADKPEIDPTQLRTPGTLTICADISSPPMEYYDDDHKAVGGDIDMGDAMAAKLGLETDWRQTGFSSLVTTLIAGHCDLIMSTLYINEERLEVVDMIHYFNSGTSIITTIDNPKNVTGLDKSLCGLAIAAQSGTSSHEDAKTAEKLCKEAGLPDVTILIYPSEVGTIQQLNLGRADAVTMSNESGAYLMGQEPDRYAFAGGILDSIESGIAIKKGNDSLRNAIQWAFDDLVESGEYLEILTRHGLEQGAITAG